eukprot:1526909-Amphidinium_carterae.1
MGYFAYFRKRQCNGSGHCRACECVTVIGCAKAASMRTQAFRMVVAQMAAWCTQAHKMGHLPAQMRRFTTPARSNESTLNVALSQRVGALLERSKAQAFELLHRSQNEQLQFWGRPSEMDSGSRVL